MLKIIVFCSLLLAYASSEGTDTADEAELKKQQDATPTSVDSRFFDLGGMFNQLLPGFNQGNRGPTRNPNGMGFPTNSQFFPTSPIQNQAPQNPIGSGSTWPIIDDASKFPNQGQGFPQQQQYPNQGNFGGFPQIQYPGQGNFMGSPNPQYPNQGGGIPLNQGGIPSNQGGGIPSNQVGGIPSNQGGGIPLNQGGGIPSNQGGGIPSNQFQQFPNQGINGGQNQNMYPANFGGPFQNQYPQNGNQGNFGGMQQNQYPNQGSFGTPMNQYPQYPNNFGNQPNPQYPDQIGGPSNQFQQFPNFNGGMQNQNPNQGGFLNQNPNNFKNGGDGTLDSFVPPQNPWNNDAPNDFSPTQFDRSDSNTPEDPASGVNQSIGSSPSGGTNAIRGRPVIVPSTTTESGQLVYPSSTESPAKKQCVQDCQTTTEYNPVCGSDNITYINPGKFVCARNCGIEVFVVRRGRCPNDTPFPRNVLSVNQDVST